MTSNPLVPVPVVEEQPAAPTRPRPTNEEIAAWVIIGVFIIFILFRHLVPGLVAGLALYLILDRVSHYVDGRLTTGPDLELLRALGDQHVESADSRDTG